ncbi:HAD family hydrolase [Rhizobium laguerreae]|uniref:HAD family hydrolase n=1 Tax=Rhizobium laguerreae TaxID=1076926 RepID=UPI0032B2C4EB
MLPDPLARYHHRPRGAGTAARRRARKHRAPPQRRNTDRLLVRKRFPPRSQSAGRLAALRQSGITLLLATNQEHRRARYLMEQIGLKAHFDDIIYSAALGHSKPSPDFFRLATERTGVLPGEIAFIDDMAENIEAARQFGWNAAQWTAGATLGGTLPVFARPA